MTDNTDNEQNMEKRLTDLEIKADAMFKYINRRNEELLGSLLILSLPMSDKRRVETSTTILNRMGVDDAILKNIIILYLREGIRSNLKFDDLIEPLINSFGFDKIWRCIDQENIRELFGEVAVIKWLNFEKYHPCKNEVNN